MSTDSKGPKDLCSRIGELPPGRQGLEKALALAGINLPVLHQALKSESRKEAAEIVKGSCGAWDKISPANKWQTLEAGHAKWIAK